MSLRRGPVSPHRAPFGLRRAPHSRRRVSLRRRSVSIPLRRAPLRRACAVLAWACAVACGDSVPEPTDGPVGGGADESDPALSSSYDRHFVFMSFAGDSAFVVPWLMRAVERPGAVEREARGWLDRGGRWEAFYEERWEAPPTRAPARVLPRGSLKLMVREGDAVDGILFEEGPRRLEIALGSSRAIWTGPRGGTVELVEGAAYLADQRVDGVVLHMARASAGSAAGGDWAFLMSGDSLQVVLAAEIEHGSEAQPVYRGWADLDGEEVQWPAVRLDWSQTQAFPPARRDVPVAWRITTADGAIEGALRARSSDLSAGEGSGPLRPVRALFEVAGSVSLGGNSFPVQGLLVHERR